MAASASDSNVAVEPDTVDEPAPEKGFVSAQSLAKGSLPRQIPPEPSSTIGVTLFSEGIDWGREIDLTEFDGYLTKLFTALSLAVYRKLTKPTDQLLKLKPFLTAMHYALQMRLCVVCKNRRGKKPPPFWVNHQDSFQVPKPFGDLLKQLGVFSTNYKTTTFWPYPSTSAAAKTISSDFDKIAETYLSFCNQVRSISAVPLESISKDRFGTGYWLLDTIGINDETLSADCDAAKLRVGSYFADVNSTDIWTAAIAGRGIVNKKFYEATTILNLTSNAPTFEPKILVRSNIFRSIRDDRISSFALSTKD